MANADLYPKRRLLAPAAFDEGKLPSLKLARSSRLVRRLGQALFCTLVITCLVVALAPWRQTVKGSGSVIAYAPELRQQTLESPIKGRITKLGEGIRENVRVRKGDLIAEIADIDPNYLARLQAELEAAEREVESSQSLLEANRRNLAATEEIIALNQAQIVAYREVKQQVIDAAEAAIKSAEEKVEAERQQLAEHQAALAQIEADYERQKQLYEEMIVSQLKFQEAERKLKEAAAKVSKAEAYVRVASNDLDGKRSERDAKAQKAQVDIDYASGALRKAQADIAKAESEVAKATAELNKAQKNLLQAQTKVARQQNQEVRAPVDGILTRITPNQGTKILKEGDPIAVIVPDTTDRAVQIWLKGNDAPLVEPGRHVRLQFEGWPAVQFAGWPSVAVGTFGGTVASVDATDNGEGKFRILVVPDEENVEWPRDRYLRQGVRANGWVLLDRVPLWYEVWRNMNGFPPSVSQDKDSLKKPKLPKP